jgi:acyl-CoA thioester hydrolase
VTFQVHIAVRNYELDTQGHVNQAVYMQYAEHARWELMRAAGIHAEKLLASGVGPVQLEFRMKFKRELRAGDELDVSCDFVWGERKVFTLEQQFVRSDGELAAELTAICGMLDLKERRLITNPQEHMRSLADKPSILNL